MNAEIEKRILDAASSLEGEVTALSDAIHACPELGYKEHKTSERMRAFLGSKGLKVDDGPAGLPTSYIARFGSGSPAVVLLAEMDALPGIGHACGHNVVGAASVGAGAALAAALKSELSAGGRGTVLVMGCPAEEGGNGKGELVKAGAFKGVDAAMMVHPSSRRTAVKRFLGLVRLNFTFHGKASHAAAYPENGVNALDAVIQTFNAINALRQQLRSDVRVHGIITDGGKAPNIVPERAEASFYVRAMDLKELGSVKERVLNCAHGAATATGCSLEAVEADESSYPMKINPALIGLYRGALESVGLKEDDVNPEKNLGSSDVGIVSMTVPTIHPHVPIRPGINIHTREFAEAAASPDGHRAVMEGVKCLALTAARLLLDPSALDAVKADFLKS